MDVADLIVVLTISNKPVLIAVSIIVSASRGKECILARVLILNGVVPPDPHRPWPRDTVSDSAIFGGNSPYFLYFRSLFVIWHTWHTWQLEHKQSMFKILCKIRPCYGIPDNRGYLTFACSLKVKEVCIGIVNLILLMLLFLILREVLILLLFLLESLGYQFQAGIPNVKCTTWKSIQLS
jgi:hypothetical protein